MKILCKDFEDHSEVIVRDTTGINIYVYTFNSNTERKAFLQGLQCGRNLASYLVQSIPIDYSLEKA